MTETKIDDTNVVPLKPGQVAPAPPTHAVLASYTQAIQSLKSLSDGIIASELPENVKIAHLSVVSTCVNALWSSNSAYVQFSLIDAR